MNQTRREIRIELMNQLYQYDLYQSDKMPFIPSFEDESLMKIYDDIMNHIKEIDELIENHLFDYSLYRLNFVDRAIIRLATFELKFTDTEKQIIINEAVELTKIYSNLDDEKQHKFTNRLLDNLAKTIKG
ncbi:MAG: transcription antitermination factor NusB [Acholeplasmataceae bacterium]|jgi:N utilization substance protein B|nr:transcription antitermination factor NusB [Acholeplasmataceae bacterium]